MVTFAKPVVTSTRAIPPSDKERTHELFYSKEDIERFKRDMRQLLTRKVFFDMKQSTTHLVSDVPSKLYSQLYHSPRELAKFESDFVQYMVFGDEGEPAKPTPLAEGDQRPIAVSILERRKLKEKFVPSTRRRRSSMNSSSNPPRPPAVMVVSETASAVLPLMDGVKTLAVATPEVKRVRKPRSIQQASRRGSIEYAREGSIRQLSVPKSRALAA